MSKISIITQRAYSQRKLMSIKYTFLRLKCSALTDNFCDVNKEIPAHISYNQSPLHSQFEWESGVWIFIQKLLWTHTTLMGSTEINIYNVGHFLIWNCYPHSIIILGIILTPTYCCNLQVCLFTRSTMLNYQISKTKSTWDNLKQINKTWLVDWGDDARMYNALGVPVHLMWSINIIADLERIKTLNMINNLNCVQSKHMYPLPEYTSIQIKACDEL